MPKPQPKVEIVPIESLRAQAKNYRQHTPRNIAMIGDSIQAVGVMRSVVSDGDNADELVAGSGTLDAAMERGITQAIIVETDGTALLVHRRRGLTEDQKVRYSIEDNRATDLSTWDTIALAELADAAPALLDGLFHDDELAALLAQITEPPPEPGAGGDEFDATPGSGETRVQPGDIWQVGAHRIGCLSGTDPAAVARLMGDERADMVFADPPYGIDIVSTTGFVGGGAAYDIPFGGVKNRKPGLGPTDGAKPFGKVGTISRGMKAKPIIEQGLYEPVIGDDTTQTAIDAYTLAASLWPKAVHIWWGGNYYANALPPSSCWIVWDKENGDSFFADAELAWTNQPTAVRIFRHMWNGLMKASERGEKRVHPTQKPVALAEWCYQQYGQPGDVVFDPCAGSGISLIAAERLGRKARLCELSPAYCDVILRRAEAEGIGPITRLP